MDKIVAVLEYIEDEDKTWEEINRYCERIGLDPHHARDILTDPRDPLVIETDSRVRPNLRGHEMVANSRRETTKPTSSKTDVRDSTNVATIIGSGNVVNQNFKATQPVDVLPYSNSEYGLIAIGKWMTLRLFGTLKHDMKLYTLVTSVLTVVAGLPFALPFVPNSQYVATPTAFTVIDAVALVLIFYLGWGTIIMSSRTKCPRCRERFRWTRKRKVLKGRMDLPEKEVRNYLSTYSCDNPECNYKENVPETVELPKPSDSP